MTTTKKEEKKRKDGLYLLKSLEERASHSHVRWITGYEQQDQVLHFLHSYTYEKRKVWIWDEEWVELES